MIGYYASTITNKERPHRTEVLHAPNATTRLLRFHYTARGTLYFVIYPADQGAMTAAQVRSAVNANAGIYRTTRNTVEEQGKFAFEDESLSIFTGGQTYYVYSAYFSDRGYVYADKEPFTQAMGEALAAPTALAATEVTLTSFQANWTASGGTGQYVVQYSINDFRTVEGSIVSTGLDTTIIGLSPGQEYQYRVKAQATGYEDSAWSNVVSAYTKLKAPSITSATSPFADTIWININLSGGNVDTYEYEISKSSDFAVKHSFVTDHPDTDIVIIDNVIIDSATKYYCRVRAKSNNGATSAWSLVVPCYVMVEAPVATDNTNTTETAFTANWQGVPRADKYKVYLYDEGGPSPVELQTYETTGLSHRFTGLDFSKNYSYKVRAIKAGYPTSFYSNEVYVRTKTPTLADPVATAATGVTANSFVANWNAVPNATNYRLFINSFEELVEVDLGNVTSYDATGLTPGTAYTYFLLASADGYNQSGFSNQIDVTTAAVDQLEVPANLRLISKDGDTYKIGWGQVSGAASYEVQTSLDNFATIVEAKEVSALSVTLITDHSQSIQQFRIRAKGGGLTPSPWAADDVVKASAGPDRAPNGSTQTLYGKTGGINKTVLWEDKTPYGGINAPTEHATITGQNTDILQISNLKEPPGTDIYQYLFRLTSTDESGISDWDEVKVFKN